MLVPRQVRSIMALVRLYKDRFLCTGKDNKMPGLNEFT